MLKCVKTPLVQIEENLFAKVESCQKTGSVKDRFIFSAVRNAISAGEVSANSTFVEATSGNTGISLSAAGAITGNSVKIVMPSNMSQERKSIMQRFGAEIIEVGPSDFSAAIDLRNQMIKSDANCWSPMQFESDYNIRVHEQETAPEIHSDMQHIRKSQWDFVSGAGTGGTLMGVYEWAQKMSSSHRVVQVAPEETSGTHGIQGINDGADFLLDRKRVVDCITIKTSDAIKASQNFARQSGMLVGISSGANIVASLRYCRENPGRNVVTLLCDRGERYFSVL
tara:strand:- start:7611 stop:8456 length:846 start_codon:yes stop_codon:yes gene_type:complete